MRLVGFIIGGFAVALATSLLLFAGPAGAASETPVEAPPPGFALRAVKLGGPPGADETRAHLDHCRALGFNAVWVPSAIAGEWTEGAAPDGPRLSPRFLELIQRHADWKPTWIVELNPVLDDAGEGFVFVDRDRRRRLKRFVKLLRRDAGIDHFVISFERAPLYLTDLQDIVRHGRQAAPAHVELATRLSAAMPHDTRVWFAPAISSDLHLDDAVLGYGPALERALPGLPRRVGIAWSGPRPVSPSISLDEWNRSRERLGGRPLLLHDRYPGDWARGRLPLAATIGPLRGRDPRLFRVADGYVASPAGDLAISRITLTSIASYLGDPAGYDADRELERILSKLAGDDVGVLDTLRTQLLEWGGWVGERNYRTALEAFPVRAAGRLRDPAYVASWVWTVRRYPERMAALAGVRDEPFRDALLDTMRRRLAIARAVPHAEALRNRGVDSPGDAQAHIDALRSLRRTNGAGTSAAQALERFLEGAGIAELLAEPGGDQER